ncbi:hypothetical protein [Kribbella sp. NPDC051137]|uniref:hypothetical protein n=1 Tax=Kribbella sp. NPDC051137 TaxID=3155045 RepID=UPI0034428E5E
MTHTSRNSRRTRKPADTEDALSPAEEYRAALTDFTQYSTENETAEALAVGDRLDHAERAERRRRWWHF